MSEKAAIAVSVLSTAGPLGRSDSTFAVRAERRVVLSPFDAGILNGHLLTVGLKLHQEVESRLFPREMSSQTQFIIVTHNRKTMETGSVLYGVTMQEPGVSKLVSVRWEGDDAAGSSRRKIAAASAA